MASIPLYKRVYFQLRADIEKDAFGGNRLPSEQELSERYGASNITIKHALSLLREERLIKRTPGVGTFILPAAQGGHRRVEPPFNIGLVMAQCSDAFGTRMAYALSAATRQYGCGLLLGLGYETQRQENAMIRHLIGCGARGIIILPLHAQAYNTELLRLSFAGYPFVLADRDLEGVSMPYVGSDNEQAARDAANYLLELGHRHVAFLSSLNTNSTINERRNGYIRAHAERGVLLDQSLILCALQSSMPEFHRKGTEEDIATLVDFFQRHTEVTGVVAANTEVALLAEAALTQLGRRIPADMSIVCFDAYDPQIKKSHFTHIRQDQQRIAELAFEQLHLLLEGKHTNRRTLVESALVVGRSTAAPRG